MSRPSSTSGSSIFPLAVRPVRCPGGEAQRIKLVRHLGSSLTDVTYIFDEPTIGLRPHDIAAMNGSLIALRDKGNTVLVVEHRPETIRIADHVIDLGPGAGTARGQICFAGTVDALTTSDTLTGRHLNDRAQVKKATREPTGGSKSGELRPTTCATSMSLCPSE